MRVPDARSRLLSWPAAARGGPAGQCLLLAAGTACAIVAVQWRSIINPDVAFLLWTAAKVMGPDVFGVDIYEVNPPLAFLIYAPAAWAAPVLGYGLSLSLWIAALTCLSIAVFWQACDREVRLPLTLTLALFVALIFPGQFAQREQIAFILTAPYVAGHARHRGWAVSSGVMAGLGFAIKPYFLIPLVLVFATRRRIRTEERAIAATGAAYAAIILLVFQPYLFDFVPLARATYWAAYMDRSTTLLFAAIIALSTVLFALAGAPQPAARGFAAASLGFVLAALVQYKGFSYHFHAAWGFLALFLAARTANPRRLVARAAALYLLLFALVVGQASWDWFTARQENEAAMAALLPEVDRAESFLALAMGSFPAFPTALHTTADYKGLAIWPIFISAARDAWAGPELNARARRLTLDQALRELQRQPQLVIVQRPPATTRRDASGFDLLAWLKSDPGFRAAWQAYRYRNSVGAYDLYWRM